MDWDHQAEAPRGKKLSEVKVNPNIAAAFGNTAFTPAAPRAAPAPTGSGTSAPTGSGTSAADLLGDLLDDPVPPASTLTPNAAADLLGGLGLSGHPAPTVPTGTTGAWNAFGAPAAPSGPVAVAAAADDDEWSAFASERSTATANVLPAPAPAFADPFAQLAVPNSTSVPVVRTLSDMLSSVSPCVSLGVVVHACVCECVVSEFVAVALFGTVSFASSCYAVSLHVVPMLIGTLFPFHSSYMSGVIRRDDSAFLLE